MQIKIHRGHIEGLVTYEVDCFIKCQRYDGVCAYAKSTNPEHNYYCFYVLDTHRHTLGNLAYPNGVASKLLAERIASGDRFTYRRKEYQKLSAEESREYDDKEYNHMMMLGPESLDNLWFM